MARQFTDDQLRTILLDQRCIYTAGELCAKWPITRHRLRQWKKQFQYEYLAGDVRV